MMDITGQTLDIGDRVVLSRPAGRSGTCLVLGTLEKYHPKSDKVTVRLDDMSLMVTNYHQSKFYKIGVSHDSAGDIEDPPGTSD